MATINAGDNTIKTDEAAPKRKPKGTALLLIRGARYRHGRLMFKRGVPRILKDEEQIEYLTDTGFFRQLKIDPKTGKPIMPKPKRKKRRGRGRERILGAESDSVDDEPDTEGEQEV